MNYKKILEEIDSKPVNSINDLELLLNLLRQNNPTSSLFNTSKSNHIMESVKIKFSTYIERNSNVTITDFLDYLYQTDSDIKFLYTQYNSMKSTIIKKNELINDLKSLGYFLDEEEPYFSGRKDELKFMELTLNRKLKNNLLIIGEPGVGKTSMVKKYNLLCEDDIFVVEMDKVISGTKYRGEFEQKLAKILDYSKEKNIIIFIDEIHILLGVGKSEGGLSGADILKPYVTDPNIKVIGATTFEEYELLKNDRALERRFNILKLDEIDEEDLYQIFINLLNFLGIETLDKSDFHLIYNSLLENRNRQFPDKLVDFLDLYSSYEKYFDTVHLEDVLRMVLYNGY